jgi:hypothetical protein
MSASKNIASAVIANGASLSGIFAVGSATVCGVLMPAAWTTAVLTFQTSLDGVTFEDLYDSSGLEYSVTVQAGQYAAINASDMYGLQFLKVRSGTGASAVNQGAARTLQFNAVKLGVMR